MGFTGQDGIRSAQESLWPRKGEPAEGGKRVGLRAVFEAQKNGPTDACGSIAQRSLVFKKRIETLLIQMQGQHVAPFR